jgi:gas vesicle protein
MKQKKWNRKLMSQFIAGGVMGTGIALLLAPQSGKKTRQNIRHFGKIAMNRSHRCQLKFRRSARNLVERVAETLEGKIERGSQWTSKTLRGLSQVLANVK